ncbi:helix-turn-helix domain-containing protein, partial [Frankia sp. Cj3]|uniref:helix-turn-helix domain-containing protein n=1 Tax=Frankia sp. Cj3 TaxID=2880976 RepID=UPI0021059083
MEQAGRGGATASRIVAQRVRDLRLALGWSAQRLANRCRELDSQTSLTRSAIAKIESEIRGSITIDEVLVLADALGVSLTDLVESRIVLPEDVNSVDGDGTTRPDGDGVRPPIWNLPPRLPPFAGREAEVGLSGQPRRSPDMLDDVAEVARLRHPGATVTRIEASGKLPAHLHICRAEGA